MSPSALWITAPAVGGWRCIFVPRPTRPWSARLTAAAAGTEAAKALRFERVAAKDWVRESLAGLAPVAAGRFVVHGAHDRARVPLNRIGIEIEAALAFGTGHHGTTRGCLLALDWLCKSHAATAHPRSRHRHRRARHRRGARPAAAACWRPTSTRSAVRVARANAAAQSRRQLRRSRYKRTASPRRQSARARRSISSSPISCCGRCKRLAAPLTRLHRARRACRAVRPADVAGQCGDRRLSRPRARTAHRARRLDDAGLDPPQRPCASVARGVAGLIDCRHVRSAFPIVRGSQRARRKRAARRGAARGTSSARPRRLHRAARRPLPERICAALRRAARLAHRLHRLGRHRHRARRPRGDLRRRPLPGAGARGSRRRDFHRRASGRAIRRRCGSKTNLPAGSQARLFAVAAYGRRRRAARQGLRGGATPRWFRSRTIRSTPSGPTGRSRRSAPWCCTTCAMPAKTTADKLERIRAEIDKIAADALVVSDPQAVSWLFNIRGSDVPHTPVVLAFAIVPKDGPAGALCRPAQARQRQCAHRLEEIADVRAERRLRARSCRARQGAARRAARSRRPARKRSRGSSSRTAARSCAAAIRSRR